MRTTKTIHAITRAALVLIVMLMTTITASATDFITDVMVVGNKNQTDFNSLISSLESAGWLDINQDLNQGCGGNSAYIHLLYKRQSSSGNTGTPITGFYIKTGNNPPDELTDQEGHTYYLVPCQGSDTFVSGHGDLNSGCGGNSAYIFLYYTKDVMSNNTGVTDIFFNTTQSDAVGANGDTTGYDLNSGGGGAYIYMHLTTATGANVVTLTSGSGDVQLLNGHTLTGTGGADTQVSVADGATVTLSGVNHTAITSNSSHSWPGIHCLGNATIVLNGGTTNTVSGGYRSPGIYVAANKTLTIQGNGTLNATGRDYAAAGIGSGESHSSCGNITISGGTITANGGQNAAGIGSGIGQSCGNITISGGTVNATGLTYAAGIGSGYNNASCGTITISGGTVTATGGLYAAAIGGGYQSSCGNITITNGVTRVTATRHNNSSNTVGAGNNSSCGTVTIGGVTGFITMSPFVTYPYTVCFDKNGGTGTMANQAFMNNVAQNLTANAFTSAGRGFLGWATSPTGPKVYNDGQSVSTMTQTAGATVTLYAKWSKTVTLASDIGQVLLQDGDTLTGTGGQNTRVKIADGATVTFSGVNNTAIANDNTHLCPGIDCLGNATIILKGNTTNSVKGGYCCPGIYVAANKTLTIQGSGTLNATGRDYAAGIGSSEFKSSCGNITINGGTITATGGSRASGIGSGRGLHCGTITISGGTVTATGGLYASGIGSGHKSSCGNITISGGTVTATGGGYAAGIGSGYENASCGNITITNGVTHVTAKKQLSTNSVGAGDSSTCGTVTIGGVQTSSIAMSPFETYPYTVSFNANGGTGTMTNQAFMYNVAQSLTGNAFTKEGWQFQGWATSDNGPTVYNNLESVSNLTDTPGATVTLYAKWMPDPEHLSINGNTYTIRSETGWDVFCNLLAVNNNGYFTGKTVKLDQNIEVSTMAGSSGHEFSGTFDGQSDTLKVIYQNINGAVYTAPFSYVNGATIQNLIVAGSITGTGHCSGIVGETGSSQSHITNCVSNVNVSGGNTAGISMGSNVEITGCVFNGMITGTNMSSGFVGSSDSALVISNSLFAPQANSSISGGTFYNNDGGGEMTLVNSYYTVPLGTPQGKQARSIVGGDDVTVTFNGQATTYNTSGITAYSVGMVYGNTLYAGNGDTVSLNLSCTPPLGYVCSGYTPSAGTLTGTANPYTLAMPDAAVTIQALKQVAYIDSDGQTLTCSEYTVLTSNETTLEAGWYVVDHDITYNSTLTLNGNVNLILCNGKTMTVTTNSGNSIAGSALTIYGQTLDSSAAGTLNVTNNVEEKEAIELFTYAQHSGNVEVFDSSDDAIRAHDNFTFNGGSVNATIVNGDANGIYATNDITINGGTVNATGSSSGIYADNVTINGGTVNSISTNHIDGIIANNVTINGGTITSDNIWSPTVTLGWSNITDCITVSSFSYAETPTVSVKSGQAFCYQNGNETVIISGTLNSDQISAIGGKTLRPLTPVSYVDGNGGPHTCDNYTVLKGGGATTLTEGWYVVDDNITYTGTLTLAGDVTLILCNGKTMTVNPESGYSIYGLINMGLGYSLTIYGQTLDSNAAGTLHVTNYVENKDAIELFTYTQHSGNVVVSDSSDTVILIWGDFTLNGGTVNTTGDVSTRNMALNGGIINATGNAIGFYANNMTINGSIVTASGSNSGIEAADLTINSGSVNATSERNSIYVYGNMTINGGTVNATSNSSGFYADVVTINGGTVTTNDIYSPMVTLGWSNLTDCITVGNFNYNGPFTVSVKSGQALCYQIGNETVTVSGTLNSDQIDAIGGKTLVPCVTYVDGNGETRFCTDFTVLEGGEATTLAAGWYVVDQDITYTGTLTLAGDVTLILCNGKTMTINPGSGNSICGLINMGLGYSLTIYGQTLDSDTAGTLDVTNNDEDKNAIELSTYTQYSGNVVVSDSNDDAIYAYGDFTINGGTINVTADVDGIDANGVTINGGTVTINSIYTDIVTINGGTVNTTSITADNVTVNGGTVTSNSISSFTVTLGWSNLTDCITIGSFNINLGDKSAGVSVKSGQAFYFIDLLAEELVVVSGTLNSDQIEAISGKTLRPYISVTQTIELSSGWNWFSTYIEMDPVALLEALETALGEIGLQIKSRHMVTSWDADEEEWSGGLQNVGLSNGNTYMVETSTACMVTLQGPAPDPADYTITLNPKAWTWIGFPCAVEVDIEDALAGFVAMPGDQIKSRHQASSWDEEEEEWSGGIMKLIPGTGYMFYSNGTEVRSLIFQTSRGTK